MCPTGGSWSPTNTSCPAGSYSPEGAATCSPCPGGTFGASTTMTSCTGRCPAGYACPPHSTSPTANPCPPGKYSLEASAGCIACAMGTYSSMSAAPICNGTCVAGQYCPKGSFGPLPCPPGTYSDVPAAGVCTLCPVDMPYSASGSVSQAACVSCEGQQAALSSSPCSTGLVGRYPCGSPTWMSWVTNGVEPNNSCLLLNTSFATWETHNRSCAANGPGVHLLTSQQVINTAYTDAIVEWIWFLYLTTAAVL
jgi:hypothetical protein